MSEQGAQGAATKRSPIITLPLVMFILCLALTCLGIYILREQLQPFWLRWELLASTASALFYLLCIPLAGVSSRDGHKLSELVENNARGVLINLLRHTFPGVALGVVTATILVEVFLHQGESMATPRWEVSMRLGLVLLALIMFLLGDALLLRRLESVKDAESWREEITTEIWFVDLPFAVAYAVLFFFYQWRARSTFVADHSLEPFVAGAGALEILVRSMIHAFTLSGLHSAERRAPRVSTIG